MFRIDIEKSGLLSELDCCPEQTVVRKRITFLNCFSLNICIGMGIIYTAWQRKVTWLDTSHVTLLTSWMHRAMRLWEDTWQPTADARSGFKPQSRNGFSADQLINFLGRPPATPCCSSLKVLLSKRNVNSRFCAVWCRRGELYFDGWDVYLHRIPQKKRRSAPRPIVLSLLGSTT